MFQRVQMPLVENEILILDCAGLVARSLEEWKRYPTDRDAKQAGGTTELLTLTGMEQIVGINFEAFQTSLNSEKLRVRNFCMKALTRIELARRLRIAPEAVRTRLGADGKPYLSEHKAFYNTSKSGDLLAFAYSNHSDLGVDIEIISPPDTRDKQDRRRTVAEYFFTPDERARLASREGGADQSGWHNEFLRLWTRKEALIKAMGGDIMRDASSYSVVDDTIEMATGVFRIETENTRADRAGICCSLCTNVENSTPFVKKSLEIR